MGHFTEKIEKRLSNLKLKEKLQSLYLFCVIVPLFVTDGYILYSMVSAEHAEQKHKMENVASAVQYNLLSTIEDAASTAMDIAMNGYIDEFLNEKYETPYDYVVAYQLFMKNSLFESSLGMDNTRITIYADNETIVNGGEFSRLSTVRDAPWYQMISESSQEVLFFFYYDDWKSPYVEEKRKLLLLRKMNLVSRNECEKVVKIEIDYSKAVRDIMSMNYELPVYICKDNNIMISNLGKNNLGQPFAEFRPAVRVGFEKEIAIYGEHLNICVLEEQSSIVRIITNNLPLLLLLLVVNLVLPWMMMRLIERSITLRIHELGMAFDCVENDQLKEIPQVCGGDEIGKLMHNYNRMALRMNHLIQTVYKDKLKEQEINIARQNAELLALHTQIDPHFLFNALESIRMHSVLKKEFETADMVEKLALMHRQNVDWRTDIISVRREMEFVKAYLSLQKYRFGDRLSYSLEMEPENANIQIPKLSIVTFVENACVHGIEEKITPGWIFVRVYQKKETFCLEIEDTGGGMDEQTVADIQEKIRTVSIETIKAQASVGILNACLRLKMMTDDTAEIFLESERGIGTTVSIQIPLEKLTDR